MEISDAATTKRARAIGGGERSTGATDAVRLSALPDILLHAIDRHVVPEGASGQAVQTYVLLGTRWRHAPLALRAVLKEWDDLIRGFSPAS